MKKHNKQNQQNKSTKFINLNEPLVSILTPTFNRPDWLQITLQSLINQTYSKWECILVNDFGTDVQNIVDKFNDPRIKYFQNSSNINLSGTRNVALSKSSGDYFIMLDDDDWLYKEAIEFRLGIIKKTKLEVMYTRALQIFYEKKDNSYVQVGDKCYWDSPYDKNLILVQNCSPCNCLFWSRKAQEKAGLFDTTLTTSEDWSHSVEMSRYFDFYESKMIDCGCSYRLDNSQMSGTRTGFTDHLPYLYGKWRKYATNLPWVIEHQNASLKARNLNPEDYNL